MPLWLNLHSTKYHHHYHHRYHHNHHHCNPQYHHHLQEEAWLYTAKMAGYAISIVLLVVYILTIQVFGLFLAQLLHVYSQFRSKNVKRNASSPLSNILSNYINNRCLPTSGSSSIYSGGIVHHQHYNNHYHRGHDQHPHHQDHLHHDLG